MFDRIFFVYLYIYFKFTSSKNIMRKNDYTETKPSCEFVFRICHTSCSIMDFKWCEGLIPIIDSWI